MYCLSDYLLFVEPFVPRSVLFCTGPKLIHLTLILRNRRCKSCYLGVTLGGRYLSNIRVKLCCECCCATSIQMLCTASDLQHRYWYNPNTNNDCNVFFFEKAENYLKLKIYQVLFSQSQLYKYSSKVCSHLNVGHGTVLDPIYLFHLISDCGFVVGWKQ